MTILYTIRGEVKKQISNILQPKNLLVFEKLSLTTICFFNFKTALKRIHNVWQTLLTCLHASVNGAKADLCGVPDSHDNILEA